MIFYFIIFLVIIIIQIIILGIIFSNLELDIDECDLSYNVEIPNKLKIKKLKVNIRLYLFKKINVLKIKIYKNYCVIFGIKFHFNVLKKLKNDDEFATWFILKNIWKLTPEIKRINFEIILGTENILITTFLVPTFSTFLFSIISKNMKLESNNSNKETEVEKQSKCNLKIIPRYINTNNLSLKGSLQINFNTMKVVFFIKKHRALKV